MIVLGFDTATLSTAVGLRFPDGTTLQARDDPLDRIAYDLPRRSGEARRPCDS